MIKIKNMAGLTARQIMQAARILTDCLPAGWAKIEDAIEEIRHLLIPENTLLAALDEEEIVGWGGLLAPSYGGRVFEMHPLAVRTDRQRKGVGRTIVTALEDEARKKGGLTIYLGADDEKEGGETSFAQADLYLELPEKILNFDPGTHQTAFYLKMGYSIIGVIPDANGRGKPDILMAKRL